ncbi:MAG: hypothetical protein EOO40_12185 [Deltaproteobacteria bacterium]|nr:MAG: hypothetical protein EOO40_12185 [Deltaproteobacteria bacterium]
MLQTCDINAAYVRRLTQQARCDYLVCAGYFELLRPPLLAQFELALNAHPSLLPRWRGPAPLFWALRCGARQSGVSVHLMDGRFDHGPVVTQRPFVLPPRHSGAALFRLAGQLAGRLLADSLTRLAVGGPAALHQVAQNEAAATLAPRPRPQDVALEPLAWDLEALLNFACGAPFFRTPFLRLGDEMFFVRRGIDGVPGGQLPGSHVLWGDSLLVPCRDGTARLQVQTDKDVADP